jgi:uncharacterized protein YbjT (DUF2867 family)
LDTILVVGGTGTLGRPVVERLVEDGFAARLLVRDVHRARALLDTDAEVFSGDVTDPGSVERALDGCFGVHISVSGGSDRRRIERVEGEATTKVAQIAVSTGFRLGLMAVVDRLFMGGQLRRTIELMRLMDEVGEVGDPSEANRILGAPSTTVRQWCERRATRNG